MAHFDANKSGPRDVKKNFKTHKGYTVNNKLQVWTAVLLEFSAENCVVI